MYYLTCMQIQENNMTGFLLYATAVYVMVIHFNNLLSSV